MPRQKISIINQLVYKLSEKKYTLNTVSCGILQVNTAQDLTYIRKQSFTLLIAGKPGEKNMPNLHIVGIMKRIIKSKKK